MIKICFICHGNICRSPMAEYLFKDMVNKRGLSDFISVESRATSAEALNEGVYIETKKLLNAQGISCCDHISKQFKEEDYDNYDYLIIMDSLNERNLFRIIETDPYNKVHKLLEYIGSDADIADPWYTRDFDTTWNEINSGLKGFLEYLENNVL